jgi:hypothetical protein
MDGLVLLLYHPRIGKLTILDIWKIIGRVKNDIHRKDIQYIYNDVFFLQEVSWIRCCDSNTTYTGILRRAHTRYGIFDNNTIHRRNSYQISSPLENIRIWFA